MTSTMQYNVIDVSVSVIRKNFAVVSKGAVIVVVLITELIRTNFAFSLHLNVSIATY